MAATTPRARCGTGRLRRRAWHHHHSGNRHPGHCHAAIKALPELLVEEADRSRFLSVQYFRRQRAEPGPARHLPIPGRRDGRGVRSLPRESGSHGDEVPTGVWTDSPACQQLMAEQGIRIAASCRGTCCATASNTWPARASRCWGGREILHGDKVSREATVFAWTSFQAGLDAAIRLPRGDGACPAPLSGSRLESGHPRAGTLLGGCPQPGAGACMRSCPSRFPYQR